MPFRYLLSALAGLVMGLVSGLATCAGPAAWLPPEAQPPPQLARLEGVDRAVSFERDVRPVLERRCVVCHACYDGPCQLLLSSPEGIVRGASKQVVYDTTRLRQAVPTRIGVDAKTPQEWRAKGFFSVLGGMHDSGAGAVGSASPALAQETLLWKMLALGASVPLPAGEPLPADVQLDIERGLTCPQADELDGYARAFPHGGMPYGMARPPEEELRILAGWLIQGAPFDTQPRVLSASAGKQIADWERFLNGTSLQQRIVARYLYEHWFVAHLYFAGAPAGPFFQLVRSRTPSGQPIDVIATRRPYDDPGPALYYRLRPIDGTIVHKTHLVYALSPERMVRLTALFLGNDWTPTRYPSHASDVTENPFVAFEEVPPRARYQFLLDDAHFFVDTFIRGPVCRGQIAVDVIEDHFWITFLDPDHDLSVTNPQFLAETKYLLDLPSENAGWLEHNGKQRRYLNERERFYSEADPKHRGPALDWVWDGDGTSPSALLTVFRNFDNATVVSGFVGEIPKTAWIIDYPTFERIYYDLVAGYDVYGAVTHQVATRLYMDHLRMQSENLFLRFLPADRREEIRASWYVGATRQISYFLTDRLRGNEDGTQVRFETADVKAELLEGLLGQAARVAGAPDTLNRCTAPPCDRPGASPVERATERALQRIASVKGAWVPALPEVSLLRVRVDETGARDLVYSLIHNDAHTNVAFMFGEDERRLPADDTMSVVRGPFGSYPNFFFVVPAPDVGAFVDELRAVSTSAAFQALVARWGVRRSNPEIWASADWLAQAMRRRSPTEAGLSDLNRYVDP